MPLLAGFLGALFGGLADFFARWLTRKVAFAAAAVATFTALTAALYAAVAALLVGLVFSFPAGTAAATGVWLAIPDNGPLCVAACIACDTAVALYRWNVENLRLAAYIT